MIKSFVGYANAGLNLLNFGYLLRADYENRKTLRMQNLYAISMVGCAVAVSLVNTKVIVNAVEKHKRR